METQVIAESSLCNSEAMLKVKKLILRWRDLNLTVLARVRIGCSVLCVLGEDFGRDLSMVFLTRLWKGMFSTVYSVCSGLDSFIQMCSNDENESLLIQVWTPSVILIRMLYVTAP